MITNAHEYKATTLQQQLRVYQETLKKMRPSIQATACWKCIPWANSNSCKNCVGTTHTPCPRSEL